MSQKPIALILAGGIGKRFWPIETSKSQIKFLGKSLLIQNLERLKLTGIKEVVIVVHPQDDETVSRLHIPGLQISTCIQKEPTGMAGAVLSASQLVKGNAVMVMNAEDLVDEKLYLTIKDNLDSGSSFLVGRKIDKYFPGGYFVIENNKVVGVVEKPGAGKEPSNLSKIVFDFFSKIDDFIKLIEITKSDQDDIYEKALNEMIKNNEFQVIKYDGYWYPTKYPWQILDIMEQFLKEVKSFRGENVVIKSNVVIEGDVYIGNNVKIFENTKIVGPVYIGDNTIIGNNNIVRDSYIGENCVTGFNTDITRSYVGDNCWFHSNYIGDSILEGNISMGSGSILANLRLDEGNIYSMVRGEKIDTGKTKLGSIIGQNVRIGVNNSIMPGVKIGTNSMIAAAIRLDSDAPDNVFVTQKSETQIIPNTKQVKNADNRIAYKQKI